MTGDLSPAGRSPQFAALRRQFSLAAQGEPVSHREVSRREFLRAGRTAALALGSGAWLAGCRTVPQLKTTASVAVVGAGLAGLQAAYRLRQAGVHATIYEAGDRAGGRIRTAKDVLGPGITAELGGEFIDSGHADLLALVGELKLETADLRTPDSKNRIPEAYFFAGQHFSEKQAFEAFRPLARQIQADRATLGPFADFARDGNAKILDNTSLDHYLGQLGAHGWIRDLLEVAFVAEFGLESSDQSALNMILALSSDPREDRLATPGLRDKRFRVKGGNQRVVDELSRRLRDQIRPGRRLLRVVDRKPGYLLVFDGPNGRTIEVKADAVLLALPFTLLREVELKVELPAVKKKAIAELGYGTSAKLLLGLNSRPWRDRGYAGRVFSDEPFKTAFDNDGSPPGAGAALALLAGGSAGSMLGEGTAEEQAAHLKPGFENAFPNAAPAWNGKALRSHWPTHRWSKGSFSCCKPGQWTTLAGNEITPVGNIFFAGEHCSVQYRGTMNGAAETGRIAARQILEALRLGNPAAKA